MTTKIDFETLWAQPLTNRGHLSATDGAVKLHGMETGKLSLASLQTDGIASIHEEGTSYWSGRGMRSYAGAGYRTVVIENVEAFVNGRTSRYVELAHFDAPRNASERTERTTTLLSAVRRFVANKEAAQS